MEKSNILAPSRIKSMSQRGFAPIWLLLIILLILLAGAFYFFNPFNSKYILPNKPSPFNTKDYNKETYAPNSPKTQVSDLYSDFFRESTTYPLCGF